MNVPCPGRAVTSAFRVAVLALAGSALIFTGAAQSANPKPTRVFVNAIVEQVGPTAPDDPSPTSYATVHVKLKAVDVDPSPPVCSSCPTADTGWLTITKVDPDDPRPALELSEPISWVDIGPAGASVSVWIYHITFVDGGAPGNEVVGVPGWGGLEPTRDRFSLSAFPTFFRIEGSVEGGVIRID